MRDTTQGTNYGLLLINSSRQASITCLPRLIFKTFWSPIAALRHAATIAMPSLTIEDGDIAGQLTAIFRLSRE